MPFRFSLYRAADGLGPLHTWDREYREPLGLRNDLAAALDRLLPGLRWERSPDMLFASGPYGGEDHAVELTLFGAPDESLLDIAVVARPPAVRAMMAGLRLNHCYAQESGLLLDPFTAGGDWLAAAAAR